MYRFFNLKTKNDERLPCLTLLRGRTALSWPAHEEGLHRPAPQAHGELVRDLNRKKNHGLKGLSHEMDMTAHFYKSKEQKIYTFVGPE
jgi:hypothetical protein